MSVEKFPTEEEIANIVFAFSSDIYQLSDAIRFLNIIDYAKPNTVRFIVWLIGLKLIPPERVNWIIEIYKLSEYYKKCLSRYCNDCYLDPLNAVTQSGLIRDTIKENLPWFNSFARAYKLSDYHIQDAELRVQRIFAVCIHDASGFTYNEAYCRVGFLSYLLALIFAAKGGLPLVFAEAMGHHIARAIISVLAFNRHLDEIGGSENHQKELLRLTKKFAPEVLGKLTEGRINLFEFTMRWERNLFADEHSPLNIYLIWDHIFFHITEFRYFLRFLIVAHLRAMLKANIDFNSDESIYEMKWDAMAIIDDVEFLMEKDKENPMKYVYQMFCPCIPSLWK